MQTAKNILITTGIYPPKFGGPAQYAKNLKIAFEKEKHNVVVKTFSFEDYLPSGLRHLFFFFKIIPSAIKSDAVFIFDTFSVGLPSVAVCKIFGKKAIIRTGGDFLWEQYVERVGRDVLLSTFYKKEKNNFSLKEKIIFGLTKWTLKNTTRIIFSTEWHRDIFIDAYGLDKSKTDIVENYYGPKESDTEPSNKTFIASTRKLKWKKLGTLEKVFGDIKSGGYDIELMMKNMPFTELMDELRKSYAVILVSLGDISPNLILDAIRFNKPFICTRETGIYERIKDAGTFVDPLNESEIKSAVLKFLDVAEYAKAREKVRNFNFTHTWDEIALEFLSVYNK